MQFFSISNERQLSTRVNPTANCKKDRLKGRILDCDFEDRILKMTKYQLLRNEILKCLNF